MYEPWTTFTQIGLGAYALLTLLIMGCGAGPIPIPGWLDSDGSGGSGPGGWMDGSSSGLSESESGSGSSSSGSTGGSTTGDASGSTGEPMGLHDPCDPMDNMPCADGLICYQDGVTGTLTFCTVPCTTSDDCPDVDGWAMGPACGDDGLCRYPCDKGSGPPLCPPGWECLFEGDDGTGAPVFNCLPFECLEEPC